MGVISRKIFPACVNMCICCPVLRSRSLQPVKRYKKLLAEIFAGSPEGSRIEQKIAKLCEYAAKNPYHIPKIANYLEERCFKELRYDHIKLVWLMLLHRAYSALNLLNVAIELLDNAKQDAVQIIGCQTLTRFIYSQILDEDGPVGVTMLSMDPWLALRLPPARPFHVFLRAARP